MQYHTKMAKFKQVLIKSDWSIALGVRIWSRCCQNAWWPFLWDGFIAWCLLLSLPDTCPLPNNPTLQWRQQNNLYWVCKYQISGKKPHKGPENQGKLDKACICSVWSTRDFIPLLLHTSVYLSIILIKILKSNRNFYIYTYWWVYISLLLKPD